MTFTEWTQGTVLNTYPEVKESELQRKFEFKGSCSSNMLLYRPDVYEHNRLLHSKFTFKLS